MTSKPSIMWVLNALGRSWAQAEPHLHSQGVAVDGTDPPMGKAKGLFSSLGAKSDTVLVLLKGLFCLKATGLNCSGLQIPSGSLKILSLIPALQIICCPFAAEKQTGKGQLFIR